MFGRSPSRSAAPPAPPPRAPPAPQQKSGGMMSGLGGALATGMAVGAGSEIAHRAIGSMMGGGSSHGEAVQQQPQQMSVMNQSAAEAVPQQQNPCQSFSQTLMSVNPWI